MCALCLARTQEFRQRGSPCVPPLPSLHTLDPHSFLLGQGDPAYLVALVDAIDELGAGGIPGEADGCGIGGFCMHVAWRDRGN